jgi:hypothetical protein
MKRNWDLLRHILNTIESCKANTLLEFPSAALPLPDGILKDEEDWSGVILEHVVLLSDENLIEMYKPSYVSTGSIINIFVVRLKASGHDFLDLSRENNRWQKTTEKIMKNGGAATMTLITQLLIAEAKQRLGL